MNARTHHYSSASPQYLSLTLPTYTLDFKLESQSIPREPLVRYLKISVLDEFKELFNTGFKLAKHNGHTVSSQKMDVFLKSIDGQLSVAFCKQQEDSEEPVWDPKDKQQHKLEVYEYQRYSLLARRFKKYDGNDWGSLFPGHLLPTDPAKLANENRSILSRNGGSSDLRRRDAAANS